MDIEQRQAELIDDFIKQASVLKGSGLAPVIVEATSHQSKNALTNLCETCCQEALQLQLSQKPLHLLSFSSPSSSCHGFPVNYTRFLSWVLHFLSLNEPLKRIGTHNGSLHCDEALGCFMIRLNDKFSNAQIIRSRDSKFMN